MNKSIEACKSIAQVNKILREQKIDVPATAFIYCETITEIIEIAKSYGAK